MGDYDLIVLGLGPGGEDLAEALADEGWSVLGVEPHLVGGECPYYGCIPSKMMLRGAGVLAEARRVPLLAGSATVSPDYEPVARRIRDEATDDWNDQVAADRFTGKGGTLVRAAGRLDGRGDDGRLRVATDDEVHTAPTVVIATGTAPALPPVDGLAELYRDGADGAGGLIWTNRQAVQARTAPASLIVLGGGAVGCELGQAFSRFGTAVTLVEPGPRILHVEEPESSEVLTAVFEREGVGIRCGRTPVRVTAGGDGVEVTLDDGSVLTAEHLLVAAGRHPNLDHIGLETVGLDPSARALTVDDHMQVVAGGAAVDGLYAIGDIAGRGGFTHLAVWQSRVLTGHLLGRDELFGGYHGLAWVTFTDPEIGRVGLTEEQARAAGLSVRVGRQQLAANSRGWIHGPGNDGYLKVVEDADRGVLVGATAAGPSGGEILGLLTLAVHARVPVHTLLTMHYAFPTMHRGVLEALRNLS